MKFIFEFDEKKVENFGGTMEGVYSTIKNEFLKQGLICLADGETLEFGYVDHEDDYGKMWVIVFRLMRTDWFYESVTQCVYYEEDDDEYGEDVLAQAYKFKRVGENHEEN